MSGTRRIVSITGTRADYGLMTPVYRAIAANAALELELIVTGMHLMPEFSSSLAEVRGDKHGRLHAIEVTVEADTGGAMAQAVGRWLLALAPLIERLQPHLVLLQGDRGEMLAAAVAAAHMNVAVVHMSGGDRSGSIDDSVRNAISKLAHFHLTSCAESSRRLVELGESPDRVLEVGDPALDRLRTLDFMPLEEAAAGLGLVPGEPFALATLHPVTDEAAAAGFQMHTLLEALAGTGLAAVFTYPNSDAGGAAMREALESWRGRPFLRIEANLGSRRYLSLMRHACVVIGNSSSGIVESPSLGIPAVNIGTRQHGRVRAANVLDVPFDRRAIREALERALHDEFRAQAKGCLSPYGDGHAAERTARVVQRLTLGPELLAKWRSPNGRFLDV